MEKQFNFSLEPGIKKYVDRDYIDKDPIVSVIIPFYNSEKYIEQTVTSVLNQTFPYYEILIIDDGSKDEKSLEKLEEIQKLDERIKIFHKENEGLAATRDYGASKSSSSCKYLMFLDDDDLLEPTFLECSYWTLETNKKASWAYSDSVGFGTQEYVWNKYFDLDKMKKVNELISAALVRRSDFELVNGYELREKAVNEDWNFWLKLLSKEKYPVHMSFYGQWYRRKEKGELQKASENKKRALEIINETANKITKKVEAIQYPRYNYNYDLIPEKVESIVVPEKKKNDKINILFIMPWMVTGGADLFNLNLVKGLDKNKFNLTIITTEPNKNVLRQYFEKNDDGTELAIVYDLTSFLDQKYWPAFIDYIINKENINLILNSNSKIGYAMLQYIKSKYLNIPIIDYVHMEEWYNKNGGYSRYSAMYESLIDKTLVCNENSRKILIDYFGKNEKEVETVYIGVDEEKFNPEKYNKEELKKKYLGQEVGNKKIFSYICRISEQKRPMLLLQIIAKLKENRQDFKVLVVGDGNLLNKMKEKAKELNIYEDIIFTGALGNTAEIYAISDLTINCSLKEGLALTSYESLSMGVPVVSSDVGGQKELIISEVGEIVTLMQEESDIYLEDYNQKEISDFVFAIDKILNNLEAYKPNCRKRIIDYFTIDKMIEKMSSILEKIYRSPNQMKIENAKGLVNNENLTKESITCNLKVDEVEYKWECLEYERKVYGRAYSTEGMNYKKELLKERLWNIPMWRAFIKIIHKLRG